MVSSSNTRKANEGDVEKGVVVPFRAKSANTVDLDRAAAQLLRQLSRSYSRDINRSFSLSKSWDLPINSEKDPSNNETTNSNGVLGRIKHLLSNLPEWLKCVLVAMAWIAYPLYQRLRKAEDDIEDSVTSILQVVERVAMVTNKLANELADKLPNDGMLKVAVKTVGKVASRIDKDAETARAFVKMVDELGDDLDDVINPIIKVGDLFMKEKSTDKKGKILYIDFPKLDVDAKL